MSRKHFVELAEMVEGLKGTMTEESRRIVAERLAAVCAHHNGYFDRGRFLAACGVER